MTLHVKNLKSGKFQREILNFTFVILPCFSALDGSNKEIGKLTLTNPIYDETYGQWSGSVFTAPTDGLYEFTIRIVGYSSATSGPPIIVPRLNEVSIDSWFCRNYEEVDCQKTFDGKSL